MKVALALAGEHGMFRLVDRAEAISTSTIFCPVHLVNVGPEHPVSGKRLRRGE